MKALSAARVAQQDYSLRVDDNRIDKIGGVFE